MENDKLLPIVVVDDDPDDRLLVADAFKSCGITRPVVFIESGDLLLQYLKKSKKPSLILLDVQMPGSNGFDTLQAIRQDKAISDIPIIILTTSNSRDDVHRAYNLGANSFITKPVSYQGLLNALQNTVTYWFDTVQLPNNRRDVA